MMQAVCDSDKGLHVHCICHARAHSDICVDNVRIINEGILVQNSQRIQFSVV